MKNIIKKWWFWVIVIIIAIFCIRTGVNDYNDYHERYGHKTVWEENHGIGGDNIRYGKP